MQQNTAANRSYECSGQYMFIMDKYYRQFLRDSLKPHHLTATEGMAILSLHRHHTSFPREEGYTQDELNEELHYDKAALTRAMKELENKQFVLRKPNHNDKRSSCFVLTNKGTDMLPFLIGLLVQWETEIFAGMDKNEKTAFEKTIVTVASNAGKAAQRYRFGNAKETE